MHFFLVYHYAALIFQFPIYLIFGTFGSQLPIYPVTIDPLVPNIYGTGRLGQCASESKDQGFRLFTFYFSVHILAETLATVGQNVQDGVLGSSLDSGYNMGLPESRVFLRVGQC